MRDELKLSVEAVVVLADRYLQRDEAGVIVESTGEMMDRVAGYVAQAEEVFVPGTSRRWAQEFARAMRALEFLPNSPSLMNAGTQIGLLSGCFVLPWPEPARVSNRCSRSPTFAKSGIVTFSR